MFSPGPFSCPPELDGYRHGGLVEGDADQRRNVGPVKRPEDIFDSLYLQCRLRSEQSLVPASTPSQPVLPLVVTLGIIAAGLVKSGRS